MDKIADELAPRHKKIKILAQEFEEAIKEENVINQSKLVQDIEKMTSSKNPYFGTKALQDLHSKVCFKSRLYNSIKNSQI